MNEKDIDKLLDDILEQPVPEADQERKQQAIAMAKAEFNQGIQNTARPIDNRENSFSKIVKSIGSFFMNLTNNPLAGNAFGTIAIAFVAVSAVYLLSPSMINQNDQPIVVGREQLIEPMPAGQRADQSDFADSKIDVVKATTKQRPAESELITVDPEPELPSRVNQGDDGQSKSNNELITAAPGKDLDKTQIKNESSEQFRLAKAEKKTQAERMRLKQIALERRSPEDQAPMPVSPPAAADYAEQLAVGGVVNLNSAQIEPNRTLSAVKSKRAPGTDDNSFAPPRQDDREEYAEYQANSVKLVADEPVSTFSVDVDTASYSLVRNQLNSGYLPKPQAVRAEELINYFDYDYAGPQSRKQPFEPSLNVFDSPWNEGKKLVHIGIKGYDIPADKRPDSNLVFLLDVSGSMNSTNKLPLVKQSVGLLLDTLKPTDTVSIVVYAGAAGTVLEPTKVKEKTKIVEALNRLNAGGSTAGGAGIRLAYQLAEQSFDKDAVNRIVLATDGDFNVGQQSNEDLKTLVERKRDNGVFLSVLGFGRNNYQDDMMQTLAQNGNGVAAYIDTLAEAKKVLVDEATSTLFPIAKDVKIQIEFNPAMVSDYRLVGYETRKLNREDFNNDKVDAGDIGAGHTVTAIYEITPTDAKHQSIDAARYTANKSEQASSQKSGEYGYIKIRYKLPNESVSKLIEQPISTNATKDSAEAQFSIAVAGFAQLLANGKHTGELNYDAVIEQALSSKGSDPFGYRSEFIQLVRMAKVAKP